MAYPVLKLNSKGTYVTKAQKLLVQQGYKLTVDGKFGNTTLKQVKAFQSVKGLNPDGIVGSKTWAMLERIQTAYTTLRKGSKGTAVSELQMRLIALNYNVGSVDGIFGTAVYNAVKQFQSNNGLKVDGVVGSNTWTILLSNNAKHGTTVGINEPVYYAQGDSRWGWKLYTSTGNKSQTIANSGCGTTCMAMVLATLVDPKIQPPELCEWSVKNGYRTANSGTSWSFFPAIAKKYSIQIKQTYSTDEVVAALKKGKMAIASMGKGYFTNGGHYILPYAVEGNNIICHDPAKKSRNKASISIFKAQSKCYWIFG